ncbi:MAG: hypothetical protein HFE78_00015 [Clostridiales bacterium]|nr:hypothetical protein [Clostridiales bacterium]
MKFLSIIKNKIIYPMCTYTVLICLFLFVITIPSGITSAIVSTVFYLIVGYTCGIALTNFVLRTHKINIVLRYIIHFLLNSALFFTFAKLAFSFYEKHLSQPLYQEGKFMMIACILFVIFYACIAGLTGWLHAIKKKNIEKQKNYESIFDQKK